MALNCWLVGLGPISKSQGAKLGFKYFALDPCEVHVFHFEVIWLNKNRNILIWTRIHIVYAGVLNT